MSLKQRLQMLVAGTAAAVMAAFTALPASAIPAKDVPPIGADAARFSLPVGCTITLGGVLPVLYLPLDVDIQGVAPASLGPGQQYYLTQGQGSITLPDWLTSLAPILGITKADALVKEMNIGVSAGTPSTINIAKTPIPINDIPIVAGKPLTVGLPLQGTFEIGPFTAPTSGRATLKFTGALVEVKLKSTAGFSLPIKVDCKATGANGLLTLDVGGPTGQPVAKYTGASMNFSKPASGMQEGTITSPYTCPLNGTPLGVGVAVSGKLPITVKKTGAVDITDGSGALVIPAATVNKLLDQGHTTLAGTAKTLNLAVENGTPAVQNVLPAAGIPIPTTTLTRDTTITIPLPATGFLKAGPYKPNQGAKTMTVKLGTASADLLIDGTPQTINCDAPSPNVILTEFPIE